MKKLIAIFVCMLLLLPQTVFADNSADEVFMNFYVSYENGNDANDGLSKASAFKTLKKAKEAAKAESADMTGDIVINVMEGYHFLDDTLYFTPEDSGKNGFDIIWKGENLPIISGGKKVSGFKKSDKGTNVYEAYAPGFTHVLNIYVNEQKRQRASSEIRLYPLKFWNDPETRYSDDGLYMKKSDIGFYENPEDIQFYYFDEWVQNYVKVEEILEDPDNSENVIVRMDRNVWTYNNPTIDSKWRELTMPFYIQNAFEVMDTPGECYYNNDTGMLYYIPVEGENMETATVIVPEIEKLVDMFGYDVDEKVENITFEGLKFAHTTWEALAQSSSTPRQAQAWLGWFSDIGMCVPGAVELEMTKNINFYDNHFFGLQLVGLNLKNGIEDSEIEGNAFYKLGDAAMVLGLPYTYDNEVAQDYLDGVNVFVDGDSPTPQGKDNEKRRINAGYTTVGVSYYSVTDENHKIANLHASSSGNKIMRNWVKEEDYLKYRGTWKSDPDKIGAEKAWVRYDLERPFKISEISLTFDLEKTNEEQRSGYEVLVSNDKHFETYDTVAVQTTDSNNLATFKLSEEMKNKEYRFIMVRTVAETQLALSGAIFISTDLKPSQVWQRSKNVIFANNAVNCVGESAPCSGGINVFQAKDSKLLHNEFKNLPYSAMMVGWGWSNSRVLNTNLEVAYNFMENISLILHDGGGVYTLGRMYGTTIHDNYCKDPNLAHSSFYLDQGTSSTVWENNVTTGAYGSCSFININSVDNIIRNNYSETPWTGHSVALVAKNDITEPELFHPVTNPNEKASAIMANAGLEPEYKHISENMEDYEYDAPHIATTYKVLGTNLLTKKNNAETRVKTLLDEGDFGYKKGQMSNEYFFRLTKSYQEFITGDKDHEVDEIIKLLREDYGVNEEDKEPCNIYCVYALGATGFEIDAKNNALVLEYPYGSDLSNKKVTVYCEEGNTVAYNFDNVDLTEVQKIPVLNEKTKKYEMWTLSVRLPEKENAISELTKDDWYSPVGEKIVTSNGGKYLKESIYSYEAMVKAKDNITSFKFKPSAEKASGNILFTLGMAKTGKSQLLVEFVNGKANLYESFGGKKTLIQKTDFAFDSKNVSNMSYCVREETGGKTVFKLTIDGKAIFHTALTNAVDNTLIQYYSENTGIIVY